MHRSRLSRTALLLSTTGLALAAPALGGCYQLLAAANPAAVAPAASTQAPEPITPAAGPRTDSSDEATAPAPQPQPKSTDRTLPLGASEFSIKLPCKPTSDKSEKDTSDQGPLTFSSHSCDDDASGLSFMILTAKFERPLAASADRNAKSSAIAKSVAQEACKALKDAKTTCKVGTPIAAGGVATVRVKLGAGDDKMSLRVTARYPYAAALLIGGDDASDAAKNAASSLKLPDDSGR